MSSQSVRDSATWFRQAESDARTAEALLSMPAPMQTGDVGCHVAALCAQSIEKSLKAYVLLNGATPAMNHRPDKYLPNLLTKGDPLLQHRDHHGYLSKLFDAETKATVRRLFDLTPGGRRNRTDAVNTEYPWVERGEWKRAPCGDATFSDRRLLDDWLAVTKRIHDMMRKLWIAVDRGTIL